MAFSVLNPVSAEGTGTAASITTPSFTSTAGNLLVTNGVTDSGGVGAAPYSDSKGNTWQIATPLAISGTAAAFGQGYASNITSAGAGHTATFTRSATGFCSIATCEISGADTAAPFDKTASNAPALAAANPHTSGTTTATAQADEICVAGMTHNGGGSETFASNNGFTIQTSQTATTNMPIVLSTKVVSATGTQAESYNLTANNSVAYAAGIATFKAAAGAASPPHQAPFGRISGLGVG